MTERKLACVLMGDGSLLIQCGGVLLEQGHRIAAVITESPAVTSWAANEGLTFFAPGPDIDQRTAELSYDWFFSIANLRIVPSAVWKRAREGAANFHDGPLPRHAGLNAPAWAILAGAKDFGITWHAITDRLDEGDIYVQVTFDIEPDETSLTLNMKCFEAGLSSFVELVDKICSGMSAGTPQDLAKRTYHARNARLEGSGTLNFGKSAVELDRMARALTFGEDYDNPLGMPKVLVGRQAYNVGRLTIAPSDTQASPGTVIGLDEGAALVATGNGVVRIGSLSDEAGESIDTASVLRAGDVVGTLATAERENVERLLGAIVSSEGHFQARLSRFANPDLPGLRSATEGALADWRKIELTLPRPLSGGSAIAGVAAGLARISGQHRFDVLVADESQDSAVSTPAGYVASRLPLSIALTEDMTAKAISQSISEEFDDLRRRIGYSADLIARSPAMGVREASVIIRLGAEAGSAIRSTALCIDLPAAGESASLRYDANRLQAAYAEALASGLDAALEHFASDPNVRFADLALTNESDRRDLLVSRNATARDIDRTALAHTLIERQIELTPDAPAVECGFDSLSYRELGQRADRFAVHLADRGIGPGSFVGLRLERSCDLVVAALAIWKAGAAYVPLDPAYPRERLAFMIEDSGLRYVVAESSMGWDAPDGVETLAIADAIENAAGAADDSSTPLPPTSPLQRATPHDLAYVIYTSGSTGRPKGVMVEHRNVVNFFAGMDDRIPLPAGEQPVWLAVTSLSFDISVLELFWTLSRGFKVVIARDRTGNALRQSAQLSPAARKMEFGLFYWGNDDGPGPRKYELLIEGAKFADKNGFNAVWTPERHFHAFGGPYPNPAVTGAAVAAVTQNVAIRAGSCVLPLHHPARVAEDWSIIDNISNGRTAIAFASGWMPEDFVLRPENAPPGNKAAMLRDIDVVRRLWRGESVSFAAPGGKQVEVKTLPRPVQPELPVWVTTAGNAETFREAARVGANILTHLLGQTVEEVGDKIAIYRDELRKHGRNPADHKVTLMLHTLIGADREAVREIAREPMKQYLRSAAALIKQYAWAFPAFKRPPGAAQAFDVDLQSLAPDELDAIIEFAFLRYFDDSGLFGTINDAVDRVEQLAGIGVEEIACLIDFGVPLQTVLASLTPLAEVVAAVKSAEPQHAETTESIGALISRHSVSHMQCTPAMATMLLENSEDRAALRPLRHLFVGGEELNGALLGKLRSATGSTIENMYGPTETTIWSSTAAVRDVVGSAPLGTPVANTQLYVLDASQRPVPAGLPGELYIGGDGVVRGYLNRDELTAERFLPNPFVSGGRLYRTGDLVRYDQEGNLHFLGRADNQVKVRGFRIELGEIESCLSQHPQIAEAVVLAREYEPEDVRLVGYVRCSGSSPSEDAMREHVRRTLPEFMVPGHFMVLDRFPLTPNAKIDRKAFPLPKTRAVIQAQETYVAPTGDIEKRLSEAFCAVLGVERVGMGDNFFKLGGHSLLAVKLHRNLIHALSAPLSITDIYRFPTVAGLAAHVRDRGQANKQLELVANRAAQRRGAMADRRSRAPLGN
ncbi:MAG: MupA/Atu3671 family FMN-dependent luciferase-like monooxygenase [Hyphomicrobium sp.]